MNCSAPDLPVHHHLPEFTQTYVNWVRDAIQPSHPLSSLLLLPPTPPSIRVFSNESTLHMRWPKYWSFSLSIIPSKEYPGLISFRMDWLDLLAVQGTLKSLLQYHSSKASILQCSAFFTVQLSYPYMTTRKTIALTRLYLTLYFPYSSFLCVDPAFWPVSFFFFLKTLYNISCKRSQLATNFPNLCFSEIIFISLSLLKDTLAGQLCSAKSHQSCLTLWDPMDRSPPGSSVLGILQARVLEWVTMPSSRETYQSRDQTHIY